MIFVYDNDFLCNQSDVSSPFKYGQTVWDYKFSALVVFKYAVFRLVNVSSNHCQSCSDCHFL